MKPEVLNREVLWEGNFLRSLLITYRNTRGRVIRWEAYQRIGTKGIVAVVPFSRDGEVILIKQYRPPVDRYVIEFPAGLNDKNEPLETVAKRELLEETGFVSDRLIPLMSGPLSSGASTEILTVYLALDAVDTGAQGLDEIEEIEVLRIPEKDFYKVLFLLPDDETYVDLKVPGLFEIALRKKNEIEKEV